MSAGAGRLLILKNAALAAIAGVRTKGISIANEPIDITTDDEDAIRTFLKNASSGEAELANSAIDISVDGIAKDNLLLAKSVNNDKLIEAYTLVYPSGAELTGEFMLDSYEETGEYQGAVTFTATLKSSGAWVFTP